MVDAIDNLIGALLVIPAQSNDGEPAKADIFLRQFLFGTGILALKVWSYPLLTFIQKRSRDHTAVIII